MRVPLLLLAGLVLVALFVERSLCGGSLFSGELPYGVRASVFNGNFWLTDSEGWGVVAPPVDLRLDRDQLLHVDKIARFSPGDRFIVDVRLASGESALLRIEPNGPKYVRTSLLARPPDLESLPWVDVGSCYGLTALLTRVAVVVALVVGVLVAVVRAQRRGRVPSA